MGVGTANAAPASAHTATHSVTVVSTHAGTVTPYCQSGGALACYPLVCDPQWNDQNTWGQVCYPGYDFQIGALCANNQRAYSAWTSPGVKAYAYCSSKGSSLAYPYNIAYYWN